MWRPLFFGSCLQPRSNPPLFRNGEVSRETPEKWCNCTKAVVDGGYSGRESQSCVKRALGKPRKISYAWKTRAALAT